MGIRIIGGIAAIGLVWWTAHSLPSSQPLQSSGSSTASFAERSDSNGDLSDTDADTDGIKGGESYSEFDNRRDTLEHSAGSYAGYGCTQDCSGHDAGYQWAEEHGVTDASECGGTSWSFEEGCAAYAEEQSDQSEDDSGTDDSSTDSSDDGDSDAG